MATNEQAGEAEGVDEEPPAEEAAKPQTDWHRLLVMLQEAALLPLLIEILMEFLVDLKSLRIDMILLRRKSKVWTPEQLARLPDGIRQSLASHILCEFKYTQSVNAAALIQALIYDLLYRTTGLKLKRKEVATFVISARTPRKHVLEAFGFVKTEWRGVYRSTQTLLAPITLIVLNRLSREPHNALFKCFASEQAERDASFATLEEMGAKQWSPEMGEILTGLQVALQKVEGGKMSNIVISPELVKQLAKEMEKTVLANLTTEKLLAGLSAKEVVSQYTPKEVLSQYTPKEVLSQYTPKEVVSQYTPQEVLSQYTPKEVVSQYEPEEVLSQYAPEQRLEGLDLEVIQAYLNQHQPKSEPAKPRKKSPAHRKPKQKAKE